MQLICGNCYEELKNLFNEQKEKKEIYYQKNGFDSLLKILKSLKFELRISPEADDLFQIELYLSNDSFEASYQFEDFMNFFLELFPENKLISYYSYCQCFLISKENNQAYIQIVKEEIK